MLVWFLSLPKKLYLYLGLSFAAGIALLKIRLNGITEGENRLREKINKDNERIQNEWSKIDNSNLSVDDAADSLRKRARKENS
jgi:hypothetical protein